MKTLIFSLSIIYFFLRINIFSQKSTLTILEKIVIHCKSNSISEPLFTEISETSLIGVSSSAVDWGDYDNDGDLDILLSGFTDNNTVTKIYRNDGGNNFTDESSIQLINVGGGFAKWGDYNNDGFLDILLFGDTWPSTPYRLIYHNNGDNTFTDLNNSNYLPARAGGSWGDYDNDGDLDILLSSGIFRNDRNNKFKEQTWLSFPDGNASWGDYDNDGDLDLISSEYFSDFATIYRNNLPDNSFTQQITIPFGGTITSIISGDYDNDGDLDIFLIGELNGAKNGTKIFRNNFPENTFTEQTSINIIGLQTSNNSIALGDYDNDGDLDILLTGNGGIYNINPAAKIYDNNYPENSFTENTSISLTNIRNGAVAWADYDNDGDLDVLLTGKTLANKNISKIYQNNSIAKNEKPSIPPNLQVQIIGNDVVFTWDKSTDNETPQNGLTYNIKIGRTPEFGDILSPMSDIQNGYRKIVFSGNTGSSISWRIKNLPEGEYYWSVQAIDNSFSGSEFAEVKSFTKGKLFLEFSEDTLISITGTSNGLAAWGDYDNDNDLDLLLTGKTDDNNEVAIIYRNDGESNFIEQNSITLQGGSSAQWVDYNNDGNIDIFITAGDKMVMYKNNGILLFQKN
ncbi:MAG: VCBS repeat-containing protein [Ignavibacteriae bacterium]|nr:VCBS repeat-containing protein [Ignavibacteriota bacterium]